MVNDRDAVELTIGRTATRLGDAGYQLGFQDGRDSRGSAVIALFLGVLSGAFTVGLVWALVAWL